MRAIFLAIFVLGISLPGRAFAAEEKKPTESEADDYKFETITTKEGLKFRVPKDMPIESRDGVTAPVSTEEYVYVKFKRLDKRLDGFDKKLEGMEQKLGRIEKITLAAAGDKFKEASTDEKPRVLTSR